MTRSLLHLVALSFICAGCGPIIMRYNEPSSHAARIDAPSPQLYRIRVVTEQPRDYPVGENGRVRFDVPTLGRGCTAYWVCRLKMYDHSPNAWRAIHVIRDDRVVREYSLNQLARLPVDSDGYRRLKMGE
jgi:hypothetical protein